MAPCTIKAKYWVLRNYPWIAALFLLAAIVAALQLQIDWQTRLAILAFPFAFLAATQKQKTEELVLFKELFEKFNEHYDKMNGDLNALLVQDEIKELTPKEKDVLFNYFNLCGEEYLYYRQGYIYPDVWEAWRNGMKIFLKNSRIKKLWDEELKTQSYYGFKWEEADHDYPLGRETRIKSVSPLRRIPKKVIAQIAALSAIITFQSYAAESNSDYFDRLITEVRPKAEHGDMVAEYLLACAYDNGLGVDKDAFEATKWYRKAAEKGFAPGQYALGQGYTSGEGTTIDLIEAAKWFRQAAEQGHPQAEFNLGVCLENGSGVRKDEIEATKWYRKAAESGVDRAQNNLGYCYKFGTGGLSKNAVEAVRWYRKAAEQNFVLAQCNLSVCLYNGDGVVKNFVEAYKWALLAAAQGNDYARTNLAKDLESVMTPNQIAEGQELARSFQSRKAPADSGALRGEESQRMGSTGSGFFISRDGYLISNNHVVKDGVQIRLVTSGGLVSAKVVKVDAANDLALLKAEGPFASLPIAPSRSVKLGSTVATVGFPNIGLQGFAPKLAKGEIASLSGAADDARYFQISVPVQPGNSGGALVDERGNVVGVVSAKLNASAALRSSGALPENVNYAVKSSYLLSFLESVPELSAKLKEPNTKEKKFEDVVKEAEQAAVLVLVY